MVGNLRNLKKKTKGTPTTVVVTDDMGNERVIHVVLRKETIDNTERQYLALDVDGRTELLLFPDTGRISAIGFVFREGSFIPQD
jgi:hypothetical protein